MATDHVRAEQIDTLAPLLAHAFDIDPAYRYLIPDPHERVAGLTHFFASNLRTHLPHRCSYASLASGRTAATVTLRPPGGIPISALTMLRRGLLPFAFRHGRSAVQRLFWLKNTYDALEKDAANGRPHWHVHMMAVDASLQGRGLGSQLLTEVLERTVDAQAFSPCVLTTHLPQNVVFYQRAGFEVRAERQLQPPDGAPYTVWLMAREGRPRVGWQACRITTPTSCR
jgi:GNAT superfamily N-acetyltransferase